MADDMDDITEPDTIGQGKLLDSLPTEILLEYIFKHSSLICLMQLSATCSHYRLLVHGFFTSRLSRQAANHPEIREGLARLGWTKDHKLWTCNCFKIVGGPAVTWGQLDQRKRFSGVCDLTFDTLSEHLTYINTSTTAAGKTFLIPSWRHFPSIIYWENASNRSLESNTLISFNGMSEPLNDMTRISHLSSYDNVMAFSVMTGPYLQQPRSRLVCIYNPSTLAKVTDIDLLASGSHSGGKEIKSAEVKTISFATNTMLVGLFYASVNIPLENNIQLWNIDTKNPREEGLAFIRSISHRNAPISEIDLYFQVHFSDRYVVVRDREQVKVLTRNKEPGLICQFGLAGRNLIHISLEKSRGDFIALAFLSSNSNNDPKLMVNVYSASRGVLIIQMDLSESTFTKLRYMEWFGPHLIVVLQQDNALTMMSWQEGLGSFMMCPFSVPGLRRSPRGDGGSASKWDLNCFNVDYRSITSAYEKNLLNEWFSHPITHFQTWDSSFT